LAQWTGSVTIGPADCSPCTAHNQNYYTLDNGLQHAINAPSKVVNRVTTTPNPCSMIGTFTAFPVYQHDFVDWDACTVIQTDPVDIQIQIRFIIEKPDTNRNFWRAKVELDAPFRLDCNGIGARLWWDASYNPATPCVPGPWVYNAALSKPPVIGEHFFNPVAGERYKVIAFTLGGFTLI
jgi:hypothetical protein